MTSLSALERNLPKLLRDAERRVNAHVFRTGGDDSLASIPANPDRDVDLLLMEAAAEIERLRSLQGECPSTGTTSELVAQRPKGSASESPVSISSKEESPLTASDKFVDLFKREPSSPSDIAWMNGYAMARAERIVAESQKRAPETECEPSPCSACFDAHSQIPNYLGIPDGDIADRVSDLVERLEQVWQERDELKETLAHLTRGGPKAFGPGMTPHAADCQCYVCCQPAQFCPHCGKSEPHTHRVPGSAEPVTFPHGSAVKSEAPPVNTAFTRVDWSRPLPHPPLSKEPSCSRGSEAAADSSGRIAKGEPLC